jgi:hypothetical protein
MAPKSSYLDTLKKNRIYSVLWWHYIEGIKAPALKAIAAKYEAIIDQVRGVKKALLDETFYERCKP